ncbi:MAG: hypothetical protein IJF07_05250 [Lachnospiraceae bacterium]|nr:hypothetical protein [Lachnospiraceae bacterium]
MKKFTKIIALLAAVCMLVMLPNVNLLTVFAAEHTTYCLQYRPENDSWRYQVGSSWEDGGEDRDLYYLNEAIKDGDYIVIDGTPSSSGNLEFNVRLGNLTITHATSTVVVTANSIDECYILNDSVAAINGNVTNAYVYDHATVTFNNNVNTLKLLGSDIVPIISCAGDVAHVICQKGDEVLYEAFNFATGKLYIENGVIYSNEAHYSKTPVAQQTPATTQATNQQASAPTTSTSSQQGAASSEYDDVPKTAHSTYVYYLIGFAMLCLGGSIILKKVSSN